MAISATSIVELATHVNKLNVPGIHDEVLHRLEWCWGLGHNHLDEHLQLFSDPQHFLTDETLFVLLHREVIRNIWRHNLGAKIGICWPPIQKLYKGCKSFEYIAIPSNPTSILPARALVLDVPPHVVLCTTFGKVSRAWGHLPAKAYDVLRDSLIERSKVATPNGEAVSSPSEFDSMEDIYRRWSWATPVPSSFFAEDSDHTMVEADEPPDPRSPGSSCKDTKHNGGSPASREREVDSKHRLLPSELAPEPQIRLSLAMDSDEESEADDMDDSTVNSGSSVSTVEDSGQHRQVACNEFEDDSTWFTDDCTRLKEIQDWAQARSSAGDDVHVVYDDTDITDRLPERPRVVTTLNLEKPDYLSRHTACVRPATPFIIKLGIYAVLARNFQFPILDAFQSASRSGLYAIVLGWQVAQWQAGRILSSLLPSGPVSCQCISSQMATFTFLSENDKFGAPNAKPPSDGAATAPPPAAKYRKKFRWGEYVPPADNPTALNARSTAAEVPISHLKISAAQRELVEAMYNPTFSRSFLVPPIVDHIFSLDDEAQLRASAIMAQYGLDIDSREHITNRWSQQWSRRSAKSKTDIRKLLYLCACGYDHHQRNTKYDRTQNVNGDSSGTQQRHTAAPFTGCLAHAEITTRSHKIVRIRGHFDHNDGCKKALYERIPPIPAHPSVYAVALAQLGDGASFSDIRRKNRELFQAKAYKDFPDDLASSQFRVLPALPASPVVKPPALSSAGSSMARVAPNADSQIGVKRKQLLPPSPEKSQKRHQSFGIH
ncbi:hypothetical protein GGX14DRAFT_597301 [Mycena pura]|uniref:Uncharacterized protein n=1 Tax=Mycena pura TaxID=153505 RepID=A0AAD6VQP6_9AGAR|nr:hypothetical protein GGX14DRAFT_597301 [Mycena pura]